MYFPRNKIHILYKYNIFDEGFCYGVFFYQNYKYMPMDPAVA